MHCSAIILAAGKGSRMNMDINKQYIKVDNKEVIAYTIEKFESSASIKDIIVVVAEDEKNYFKESIMKKYKFKKIKKLVVGGSQRSDSVYNGLKEVSEKTDIVVVHDGARPLIRTDEIDKSIEKAKEVGGAVVAVPVKDTIKVSNKEGVIINTPERDKLWSAQTPQSFKYNMIMEAYKQLETRLETSNMMVTDDSSLFEALGYPVHIVPGQYENIKITTQEDLKLFKAFKDNNI